MDGLETVFKGDQPNQGIEIGKDGQGLGGRGDYYKITCCGWYRDHGQHNIPAHASELFESNLVD